MTENCVLNAVYVKEGIYSVRYGAQIGYSLFQNQTQILGIRLSVHLYRGLGRTFYDRAAILVSMGPWNSWRRPWPACADFCIVYPRFNVSTDLDGM